MQSLKGDTDEITEGLRLRLHLGELERQSRIATHAFGRAWRTAMTKEPDVEAVWADLQSCMFAAIIVERILKPVPTSMRPKAGLNKAAAGEHATARAARLLELLGVLDGLPALRASAVRHDLEHVDERLDEVALRGYASASDWYIASSCVVLRTPPPEIAPESSSVGLRVFVASNGLLFFDQNVLDLYAMDAALLSIRDSVADAVKRLKLVSPGESHRFTFGSAQMVRYDQDRVTRFRRWLEIRQEAGSPVDLSGLVWEEPAPPAEGSDHASLAVWRL